MEPKAAYAATTIGGSRSRRFSAVTNAEVADSARAGPLAKGGGSMMVTVPSPFLAGVSRGAILEGFREKAERR